MKETVCRRQLYSTGDLDIMEASGRIFWPCMIAGWVGVVATEVAIMKDTSVAAGCRRQMRYPVRDFPGSDGAMKFLFEAGLFTDSGFSAIELMTGRSRGTPRQRCEEDGSVVEGFQDTLERR
jgi:hypothetical protein